VKDVLKNPKPECISLSIQSFHKNQAGRILRHLFKEIAHLGSPKKTFYTWPRKIVYQQFIEINLLKKFFKRGVKLSIA
jgi:hypothetical protein